MLIQFALYKCQIIIIIKVRIYHKKVLLHACRIYLLNSHTYPFNDDNTQGRWPKPSGGEGGEDSHMKGAG